MDSASTFRTNVSTAEMPNKTRHRQLLLLCAAALLIIFPFFVKNFTVFQFTLCIAYAISVLGLNYLMGFAGQISLGHGAFYAVGAYTAAILMKSFDVHYLLTLPAAAVVSFALGFIFGLPALRLAGHYLALTTLALAIALPQLLRHGGLAPFTGGVQGIVLKKPAAPFQFPLEDRYELPFGIIFDFRLTADRWLYFCALIVAVIVFWLVINLLRGRIGLALAALRDHPVAAQSMGINISFHKTMSFAISAMFTGLAGALGAIVVQYVAPDSFSVFLSISLVVGAVFGGSATVWGAVFGALFIQFVPNIAGQLSQSAPWVVYGVIMVAAVYFMPDGIVGLYKSRRGRK
ncbi:branched-chain amino acid ABC transporter permease [Ferrovibrio sp.]|uniref:branched-chain amino acid ABC transporter permease n=1 Tax=Ferrovibrio sp. TaxID=1917215 RepID=UPI003D0A9CAC